ncbi:MAG: 4Fe-4S binding protein, partial [Clostridia bacterium]
MAHTITADCIGCTACVKVCPVDAITGVNKELHHINPALCIDCG